MRQFSSPAKYGFRIRTRSGAVVDNLSIYGRDELDAERKLRQIYLGCEILFESRRQVACPCVAGRFPTRMWLIWISGSGSGGAAVEPSEQAVWRVTVRSNQQCFVLEFLVQASVVFCARAGCLMAKDVESFGRAGDRDILRNDRIADLPDSDVA